MTSVDARAQTLSYPITPPWRVFSPLCSFSGICEVTPRILNVPFLILFAYLLCGVSLAKSVTLGSGGQTRLLVLYKNGLEHIWWDHRTQPLRPEDGRSYRSQRDL